jgi:hypothetical protein
MWWTWWTADSTSSRQRDLWPRSRADDPNGSAAASAMELAGHRTRAVFDRYHIVSHTDLVDAAARLSKSHSRPRPTGATPGWAVSGQP